MEHHLLGMRRLKIRDGSTLYFRGLLLLMNSWKKDLPIPNRSYIAGFFKFFLNWNIPLLSGEKHRLSIFNEIVQLQNVKEVLPKDCLAKKNRTEVINLLHVATLPQGREFGAYQSTHGDDGVRRAALMAYRKVVLRTWKDGWVRGQVGGVFLRGMLDAVMHTENKEVAKVARKMLWAFVKQRTIAGVEKLVF
ncbi:hypothetical protein GUJ93_ZPchr0006g45429 [Zizania palustris]|uniref:Uncharacterized protein n=1 Tax=Zizania palustris TaxID=103762 RepID=A0A8J5T035_ZIZPA|nr:hypothetical protein GUJ93_ZPchr0006g45429 [Zizania palustris]